MLLFKGNNSYLRVECRPEVFFYVALYQQFHSLNNLISAHSHLLKLKKKVMYYQGRLETVCKQPVSEGVLHTVVGLCS